MAEQLHADLILIDDARGRRAAHLRGLPAQLVCSHRAAELGLINIDDAIDRLKRTTFRASTSLFKKLKELRKDE